jgi:hypothetical protein
VVTLCFPTGHRRSRGHRPDFDALIASPTRISIAVGEESMGLFTGRTSTSTAQLLGQQATVFPSHHGGFIGGESGHAGQPEAFARAARGPRLDNLPQRRPLYWSMQNHRRKTAKLTANQADVRRR